MSVVCQLSECTSVVESYLFFSKSNQWPRYDMPCFPAVFTRITVQYV